MSKQASNAAHRVPVTTRAGTYTVSIGPNTLSSLGTVTEELCPLPTRTSIVVADAGLPKDIVSTAMESLREVSIEPVLHTLTPTEQAKSFQSLEAILVAMSRAKLERGDPVIALGGGITGDVAGLAAALHHRGTPVLQCPTTLLAMVDASVGGKTAVNLTVEGSLYKNMVGAFSQPVAVLADTNTLASLPDRAFRSGIAECIKHTMLCADWGHESLIQYTDSSLDRVLTRDPDILPEFIARNVAVKASVVQADETEDPQRASLGRAVLNLGHTFAHALESHPELSPDGHPAHAPLTHGEAVALGLVAASAASEAMGIAPNNTLEHTSARVARAQLPTQLQHLPREDSLVSAMTHDKKVRAGKLRLVLPTGDGHCTIIDNPPDRIVLAGFSAWQAG
ncbi:MAG: 3-dehydroquinate synthase [Phycisphaeraceae bacterium]|nr:3-dehydroquinate synthase [Phycisphaerales bacterium]MCB9860739.1 3-dehydroquinate synthase [Phycisphaeraceae bacterium]